MGESIDFRPYIKSKKLNVHWVSIYFNFKLNDVLLLTL